MEESKLRRSLGVPSRIILQEPLSLCNTYLPRRFVCLPLLQQGRSPLEGVSLYLQGCPVKKPCHTTPSRLSATNRCVCPLKFELHVQKGAGALPAYITCVDRFPPSNELRPFCLLPPGLSLSPSLTNRLPLVYGATW